MLARCSFHFFQRCNQGQRAQAGASVSYYFTGKVVDVAKLSDKDRKKMISDRVSGMKYKQIAEKYHVCETTARNVCKSDPKTAEKCADKKEANTIEMLAYMDAQKGKAQELLSKIIDALGDSEKLSRANVRDLATAYGIIADKFLQTAPTGGEDVLARAREMLGGIDGVIK
jgi:hypothetical protein